MQKLVEKHPLGRTGVEISPVIFGTSCLGNLYRALPYETKLDIMREWFHWVEAPVTIDSAGKYGAGLALEAIGQGLRDLQVAPEDIVISNKLGWKRVPLETEEPTFEPGVWADVHHDAVQEISYDGIMRCYEQGRDLLGEDFVQELVSVHDPDEYVATAPDPVSRQQRLADLKGAYQALNELKRKGATKGVGIGAKDWGVIQELSKEVELDWVMFACSLTPYRHENDFLEFVEELRRQGVGLINSAVFNAGFLIGGDYFDYTKVYADSAPDLFAWRECFFEVCETHEVSPAHACVQFGMSAPGIVSVALNTSKPERIKQNVHMVQTPLPDEFWRELKDKDIIAKDYPYLGN